jgi:hypothetical protein
MRSSPIHRTRRIRLQSSLKNSSRDKLFRLCEIFSGKTGLLSDKIPNPKIPVSDTANSLFLSVRMFDISFSANKALA